MQLLNDFFKTYDSWGMPTGNTTCQMGGWFRKEIKTLDDMKGLKVAELTFDSFMIRMRTRV